MNPSLLGICARYSIQFLAKADTVNYGGNLVVWQSSVIYTYGYEIRLFAIYQCALIITFQFSVSFIEEKIYLTIPKFRLLREA